MMNIEIIIGGISLPSPDMNSHRRWYADTGFKFKGRLEFNNVS